MLLPLHFFPVSVSPRLCLAVLLMLSLCWPSPLLAHERGHKHLLVLHSSYAGSSWTDAIMASLREELSDKIDNLQFHVEYLDTNRHEDSEHLSFLVDAILHHKFEDQSFDLILLSGNEALSFALEHRNDLFASTPIVFCGVNNFKPSMLSGFNAVVGVTESPDYRETIALALKLHPGTEEVVVIGTQAKAADRDNRELLQAALPEFAEKVKFVFWDDLSANDLTAKLKRLQNGSLVLINGSVNDRFGHTLSLSQSTRLLRNFCPVPLYSLWEATLGEGIVGGSLVSASTQGRLAGQLAFKILQGENPDDIAVITAGTNQFMFDYDELKRFGVSLDDLPENGLLINQPPPFYELSMRELWIIFGIMTFFAGSLLANLFGRRKAEKELHAREAQVKLLLNSAAEGVYGLDLEGHCTFCNRAALRMLGYKDEKDLLGKNMHTLTHHTRPDGSSYPAEECCICQAFYENEGYHYENEVFWRADGSSFPVEYWAYPLREEGKPVGAVVSFVNIFERKQAEAQLMEANRELDAFVYTVSHDLRAPLTAIVGFTELLKDEYGHSLDNNVLEILSVIEKQGDRMSALIEDLLSLATVGTLSRPDKAVDVEEAVDAVLLQMGSQFINVGVTVQRGPLPDIRLPETLLSEIFENLLLNALRYAGRQGSPIEVGGEQVDSLVRFYVRDHGPGVPEEERDSIFKVFCRGSATKEISGTGVGLATVQKIARLFGGRAWVEETPGGGATFWVELENPPAK